MASQLTNQIVAKMRKERVDARPNVPEPKEEVQEERHIKIPVQFAGYFTDEGDVSREPVRIPSGRKSRYDMDFKRYGRRKKRGVQQPKYKNLRR